MLSSKHPNAVVTNCPDADEEIRIVERVIVTHIVVGKGRGTDESVFREAHYWYDDNGKRIGMDDPFADEQGGRDA